MTHGWMGFPSTEEFLFTGEGLPCSNDLPMYDLSKGSTRVKLEYDP